MGDRLDVLHGTTLQLKHSIRHDNRTGRWLTTFQAIYHPTIDNFFAVGSMLQPRCVELFHGGKRFESIRGEAMQSVASRLAFHPRSDRIVLAGGNSSGRVTLFR